jgi:two-component system, NarL family, sensor kinase
MDQLRKDVREAIDPQAPRETALVRIDHDGTIRTASASAAAMLGYTPAGLAGRPLAELAALGARAPVLAAVSRFAFGTGEVFDLQLEGRSGRRTPIRLAVRRLVELSSGETEFVTEWEERPATWGRDPTACEDGPESKRFAYDLLTGQEAERQRVTSDLHGAVAPVIHMAKFAVERAMQQFVHGSADEALEAMSEASLQLKSVLTELRKISSELRPSLLDDLGLIPTIDWICRRFEETYRKPRVERIIDVREQQVADHLKLEIFRIIQEALSNVARHAEATRAQVTLTLVGDELLATVEDDGVGFDANELFYGSGSLLGIGLLSIRKRICATGGRMLLDSVAGRGTLIGAAWKVG